MNDAADPEETSDETLVPVCAVGASAGGVTALQDLFRLIPVDLGLAYVVILHLSPDQPSALSDILSVCTRMPVRQIHDEPTLKPNCVYVIPPDRELVIEGDSVAARAFSEPRGKRAPIDMFFRSVSVARGDGIAVVLSGAGSDGAMGVRAIKEGGGVIMVQEPAEAGFPSMPQSAIATGAVDFVAPLARLAERMAEVARSKEAVRSLDAHGGANELRRIVASLRARTGHDFSSYKRATVLRRVKRRMQVCRTDTFAAYADYLLATPEEAKELLSDLLISVTMFFRDARAFEALERQVIKAVFDDLDPQSEDGVRAWVVGCATGEEAYAVAMLMQEEASRRKFHGPIQIFASDLDDSALATAREGRYLRSIEADVSEERLARFFVDEGTHYRVRKELRDSVLFAKHSVIKEPPFMRLDLITCRNLLIYLERALQLQLCSIFHYGLKRGRYLFLGSAETADAAADLFTPLDREARIYVARQNALRMLPLLTQFSAPERFADPGHPVRPRGDRGDLPAALHVLALERIAPASALVDSGRNILHLSPGAGRYILHSAGPVSTSLPGVVRPELRLDLGVALTRALDRKEPSLTHPAIVVFDGERRSVVMHVGPVPNDPHMGAQALVFFLDGGSVPDADEPEGAPDTRPPGVQRLQAELKAAQEALLASRGGHEASMQNLRTTNEELQSINEEYRSTAEELETSKEELQSINEELHTVNAELKSKLSSISVAHSDLQNLTTATEIGTVFLDSELRIKMFTPPIAHLFNIARTDVGRPITNFTHCLEYDRLEGDARKVLADLAPIESEVRSVDGRWYAMRLRPYRTIEDRIDGVVVTFVDVSVRRQAEAALRASEAEYRNLFNSIDEGFCTIEMLFDENEQPFDYRFLTVNAAFDQQAGLSDVIGKTMRTIAPAHEERWFEIFGRIASSGRPERFDNRADALGRWFDVYAFRVGKAELRHVAVLFTDILPRKRIEAALRQSEARFRAFVSASSDAVYRMAPDWSEMRQLEGRAFLSPMPEPSDDWLERYIYREDQPAVRAAIGQAIQAKSVFELEHRVIRADGSLGWTKSCAAPILTEQNEIAEWLGTARDVTAAKDAEATLRGNEERRAFLLKLADLIRPLTDPNEVADAACRLLVQQLGGSRAHYSDFSGARGEEMGKLLGEFVGSGEPTPRRFPIASFGEPLSEALRAGQTLVVRDVDRDPRLAKEQRSAFHDARAPAVISAPLIKDGRLVAVLTLHDIKPRDWGASEIELTEATAERSWAALERARVEEALRESEARFQQFAEASSDVLWIRSADDLSFEFVSRAFERIYGLNRERLVTDGDTVSHWIDLVDPEDREITLKMLNKVAHGERVQFEFRVERPDGEVRWVQNTDFPLLDGAGRVQRIGGIAHDVTEEKATAARMEVLIAELQHRTRNLLGVVRALMDQALSENETFEQFRETIHARLGALGRVNGLLSRLKDGDRIPFDELIDVEMSAVAGANMDRQVTLEGPKGVRLRSATLQTLSLALHELATNAVKYGALSDPKGRLSVMWRTTREAEKKRWLHIDWRESGVAVDASVAASTSGGYGRQLIEETLPHQLGARVEYLLTAEGLRCSVSLPIFTAR